MIKRFTKIKGIGRFNDCHVAGREFRKNTIIFGPNTEGKSTFTDILRSLKTGNKSIIEGRKTFDFNGKQEVEFDDENNNHFKFPSQEWNLGYENIEIFDTQFINENIFEGNEISYIHQKKLNSIVIGTEGNNIVTEINLLQSAISELSTKKTSKTTEFNRIFKKEITVKEFASLSKVENIDALIEDTRETIENVNNQSKIKSVFETIETLLSTIINQNTKIVLSNSIQVKADLVKEHILKTWKNPSKSIIFLQTGLSLTKENEQDCVFCGQELNSNSKELLSAYSQLFSQKFIELQSEIADAVSKFEKWNPKTFTESIKDKLDSVKISIDLTEVSRVNLDALKKEIDLEFEVKIKDIGLEVNFEKYDLLIQIFSNLKLQVDELKKEYVFTTEVNVEYLNRKIKELEFSKTRHMKEWDDFIKEYDEIDSIQSIKKDKRESLRKRLDLYSKNLFDIHFDTINKILKELNADFEICDFQPIKKIVGQSERIFALKFFKTHKVSIDELAIHKPNFKNTLSESDKRVLSFAFFYSLMVNDNKLYNKIIVFDDPFSSFDSDRRLKTVQLLANPHLITPDGKSIKKSFNQLIILTHESEFFKWIYLKLDNPKPLKITQDGANNGVKKSTIVDCDVDKEFLEDRNKKDLKEIREIHSSNKPIGNYEELCTKCRKILESIFTRKYFFDLEEEIRSRKSIRSFVKKLGTNKINNFEDDVKQREFIFLCDNLNIELHDNSITNEGQNANSVLRDFLKLVKQV